MNAVPNISGGYMHSNLKKIRNVIQEGRLVKIIYEEYPICGYGELFCNQKNIWQLLFWNPAGIYRVADVIEEGPKIKFPDAYWIRN